jgi:hypothetical protein
MTPTVNPNPRERNIAEYLKYREYPHPKTINILVSFVKDVGYATTWWSRPPFQQEVSKYLENWWDPKPYTI